MAMPFDLLGFYFKRTFGENGSFVQFSTIPRKGTLTPYSAAKQSKADDKVNKLAIRDNVVTVNDEEIERTRRTIRTISAEESKFRQLDRYKQYIDPITHDEYQMWPTLAFFRQPEIKSPGDTWRTFLSYLDEQGGTSNRRYLGAYYELCIYFAFLAYFAEGTGKNQKITYLEALVRHDMRLREEPFEEVIRTIGIRFIQSLDKGLLSTNSGQLNQYFKIEYQRKYSKGDKDKFADFLFTPIKPREKLQLTGRLHGIGEVIWEYSYASVVVAEMKSKEADQGLLSAPARSAVRQAADYSDSAIPVFFGLLRINTEQTKPDETSEYGSIYALKKPRSGAEEVHWELHVNDDNSVEYTPRHLVDTTPKMRFTKNTNIWKLASKFGILLTEPGFFLPFESFRDKKSRDCIWVTNPFTFDDIAHNGLPFKPTAPAKGDGTYALMYNGNRGTSLTNFLLLKVDFKAKPICTILYWTRTGYKRYDGWPEFTNLFSTDVEAEWNRLEDGPDDFPFWQFCQQLFGDTLDLSDIWPSIPEGQEMKVQNFTKRRYTIDAWNVQTPASTCTPFTYTDFNTSEMFCMDRENATVKLHLPQRIKTKLKNLADTRIRVETNNSCLVRCERDGGDETVNDAEFTDSADDQPEDSGDET